MTTELAETTTARIAELVAHLTGCHPDGAAAAVASLGDDHAGGDDPLALVARAVCQITDPTDRSIHSEWSRPAPAIEGFRMAGYVRQGEGRVIDLRDSAFPQPTGELRVARYVPDAPARPGVAEHLSLRRWERTPLTLSRSEAAPLRMAPKGDAAVAALLAAGQGADAMLLMAVKELGQHSQRLLGAFQAAGQRLGEHLSPGTLERTAGGAGDTAHVWKIYSSLWTALGFGVGKGWTDGYAEAAASYLAAAYDDPQWAEKVSAKVAEQATEKAAR